MGQRHHGHHWSFGGWSREIGPLKFSGWLAWMAWLTVHLVFLVGFRNRFSVLFQWAYSYLAYKRSARIITYLPHDLADDTTVGED